VPGLRKHFGAKIREKRFRRANLVPRRVRLALSLRWLRLALLGLPPDLSGHRQLVWL